MLTLGGELGSGSFARVRLARDERTHDVYAVKIRCWGINREDQAYLDRMYLREIDALEAFADHPNVVRLVSYTPLSMVFERCDASWLAMSGKLDRAGCERARDELVSALRHIHARGWLHRDVSPSNVLFVWGKGGVATTKLADFGAARRKERAMTRFVVTRWYRHRALLEGAEDDMEYGEEVDWWAAATTIAELATGVVQFRGSSDEAQLALLVRARWTLPEEWTKKMVDEILGFIV